MNLQPSQETSKKALLPGLKPASVRAAGRPHGDRLLYAAGCRCDLCRGANAAYERERSKARRAGQWNGLVSAEKARRHIEHLSTLGVGRRAISQATDIAEMILMNIRAGRKTKIRALTERRILAVTADMALDRALIDAGPTWVLIDELLAAGHTKKELAQRLGYKAPALQISRTRVTVRNAETIRKLHLELSAPGAKLIDAEPTWCLIKTLRAEGFSEKHLARLLDLPDGEFCIDPHRVSVGLAERVAVLYERLMA